MKSLLLKSCRIWEILGVKSKKRPKYLFVLISYYFYYEYNITIWLFLLSFFLFGDTKLTLIYDTKFEIYFIEIYYSDNKEFWTIFCLSGDLKPLFE